jgi:hypothetical protein
MPNPQLRSNITDLPRLSGEEDLLGIDDYSKALEQFIEQADTPMTVAIQGEWGSGKTSMMNQIRFKLCEGDNPSFTGIWLNTWQFSLFCPEETALIRIIKGIFDEVAERIEKKASSEALKQARKIASGVFRGATRVGLSVIGSGAVANAVIDDVTGGEKASEEPTVFDLRNSLENAIEQAMENSDSKGFLIFIDDLDRLEPRMAVQILELLKNIFDIKHCVFLLAIDYDVVVKGLEPKFGPISEKNEREFRAFFDKIIQMPFSMPLAGYQIDRLLIDSLLRIGYFSKATLSGKDHPVTLSLMAEYSIGRNPRAMKRLMNILSLIQIFNGLSSESKKANDETYEKIMNFGLICLQLAYPKIYSLVSDDPNFLEWGEDKADEMRLEAIDASVAERLSKTELFNDPWEKFLFRFCQRDPYLAQNVSNISNLLNKITQEFEGQGKGNFLETLERLLALSSVTEVEAKGSSGPTKRKWQKSFLEGLDDWFEARRGEGFCDEALQLLSRIHDEVLALCSENDTPVEVKYSGMLNFFIPGKRKAFMITWAQKTGPANLALDVENNAEGVLPNFLVIPSKGSRTQYRFENIRQFEDNLDAFKKSVLFSIKLS